MKTFEKLKKDYQSGKALNETLAVNRFDLGTHKKTRLRKAGVKGSGSLLHKEVSEKHAELLKGELVARAKKLGLAANERLRFVTLLQAVVDPTIEKVSEAVTAMERQFKAVFGEMKLWSRGAIELEMVNLTILAQIAGVRDDEARKLNVLSSIGESEDFMGLIVPGAKDVTRVLVHCHVVVDFGKEPEKTKQEVEKRMKRLGYWAKPYQKDLSGLYKTKSAAKNLRHIAAYVTKGGNENLRYNAGFGRDLAGDLEARIWREGTGRKDSGGDTVEDERGLTLGEVKRLDELYVWLMNRRKDKRGYLIWTSGR
jgi:hypothetical protein